MIAVRKRGDSFPLTISGPDLAEGAFPREFTCDGANRRPRLQWSMPPAGTQELAIETFDPDAPGGTFTHWLVCRLPSGISSLAAPPTGRQKASTTSAGAATAARSRRAGPLITPACGPRAGHPAGPGIRSDKVRPGVTHQRSCAGQGRARGALPAHLTGSCRCQPSPITGRRMLSTARFHMPHQTSPLAGSSRGTRVRERRRSSPAGPAARR